MPTNISARASSSILNVFAQKSRGALEYKHNKAGEEDLHNELENDCHLDIVISKHRYLGALICQSAFGQKASATCAFAQSEVKGSSCA